MAGGLQLSGLASGVDTSGIVEQLMALERQPQVRMKLRLSQSEARKQVLNDVLTRLKNLQSAARDLKSAALWGDTQTVEVNDSTKLTATRTSGVGAGSYQVTVDQLARGSQRWFTYTEPTAGDDTITWSGGHTTTIPQDSDINAAVAAINADSQAPVYASAVTDAQTNTQYLVFSSRTTGLTASAFTASAASLTEDGTRAVAGLDARYSVDGGVTKSSPTNVVTDLVPGLTLTLKGTTTVSGPVSVTVGAPGPDPKAISDKVKAFVEQYNSTLDFIRSKLDEKKVANPTTTAEAQKGMLANDTMLNGILSGLRIALTDQYAGLTNPDTLDQLAEIGVSTGSAITGTTLNTDSVKGKLSFDAAKFATAMASDPLAVRRLLGGDSNVPGFAQAFEDKLTATVQAGGTMDLRISSEDANRKRINDQITRMDGQLAKKQELLTRQFAAMESALAASQAQGQWLAGQLAGLQNNR